MADYKIAAIATTAVVIVGGVAVLSLPAIFGPAAHRGELSAFGIKSSDSIFGYHRQPSWHEVSSRLYAISPPRPDPAFKNYAIQSDPSTDKVCAVHAATSEPTALNRLKADLSRTYGEPETTGTASRWTKGSDFVEIITAKDDYRVVWDFTGQCVTQNRAISTP